VVEYKSKGMGKEKTMRRKREQKLTKKGKKIQKKRRKTRRGKVWFNKQTMEKIRARWEKNKKGEKGGTSLKGERKWSRKGGGREI